MIERTVAGAVLPALLLLGIADLASDRIVVKGSRIDSAGESALVAAEVTKGRDTLLLRDEAGVPAWSGGGRSLP